MTLTAILIPLLACAATDTATIDLARLAATRHIDINARRGFTLLPETIAAPGSAAIPLPKGRPDISIEVTAESVGTTPGALVRHLAKPPAWGMTLTDAEGHRCTVSIRAAESDDDGFGTRQAIEATVEYAGETSAVKGNGSRAGIGSPERIRLERINGEWDMTFTSDKTFTLPPLPIPPTFTPDSLAISTEADRLTLRSVSITRRPDPAELATRWSDTTMLDRHIARSADPLEGYWRLYDFTLEQQLIRTGGDYRLAIVRDGDGYLIVYLGGARTAAAEWHPGMIKGQLRHTPFPGIYDLVWLDASFLPMSHQLKAVSTDGDNILTIDLPYQQSTFRLRKYPAPK